MATVETKTGNTAAAARLRTLDLTPRRIAAYHLSHAIGHATDQLTPTTLSSEAKSAITDAAVQSVMAALLPSETVAPAHAAVDSLELSNAGDAAVKKASEVAQDHVSGTDLETVTNAISDSVREAIAVIAAKAAAQAVWSAGEMQVIDEACYVAHEVRGGTVVTGDAFMKAMPLVIAVLSAISVCSAIKTVAERKAAEDAAASNKTDPPLVALEKTLAALMAQISPVTIQSLKDTQLAGTGAHGLGLLGYLWQALHRAFTFSSRSGKAAADARKLESPADRFSDQLLYFTMFVLMLTLANTFVIAQHVADVTEQKREQRGAGTQKPTPAKPPQKPPTKQPAKQPAGPAPASVPSSGGTSPSPSPTPAPSPPAGNPG